jgi:hypothetical protein
VITGGSNAAERLRAFAGRASPQDALALFDELPAVTVEQLLGPWKGASVATGSPLDGLLEAYGWYGKRFDGPDEAHPLVFADGRGRFSVNPAFAPLSLLTRHPRLLRQHRLAAVGKRSLRLLQTHRPRGRLRMVEHRGVLTGTLIYDDLPVNDHFRAVDRDTLLGAMDLRGLEVPFLFLLRREADARVR